MGVAHSLMPGIDVLAAASPRAGRALALVAGQILECSLKAFVTVAVDAATAHRLGHEIDKLWRLSVQHGLSLNMKPPMWASILAEGHGAPFFLRYGKAKLSADVRGGKRSGERKGDIVLVHGGQLPPPDVVARELPQLVGIVEAAISRLKNDRYEEALSASSAVK